MLVFDETRRMSSAEDDLDALRTMIKRDRNHPSVFLWGIGNEEIFAQHRPEMARSTVTMKMEVRRLDKTRPITSAVVCWNGKERFDTAENYVDVTKHLDVMGFNYCKTAWDDYHNRMPNQPVIVTEDSTTVDDDAVIVNICAVDENGDVVPTADNEVNFEVVGAGEFLGCGNGNPGDHANDKIPARRLFNGWAQLLVKLTDKGTITVKVNSNGIKGDKCKIKID